MLIARPVMRRASLLLALLCLFTISGTAAADSTTNRNSTNTNRKIGRIVTSQPLGPPSALAYTVYSQMQTLIDAWVEYSPTDCTEISPGSWTVTMPPTNGTTTTGTITGTLGNGDCPGIQFTFAAIFYTWTSTDQNATMDSFAASWMSPDFQVDDTVAITLASVTIQSADLVQNNVAITVTGPDGVTAPLVVKVIGANNTYTLNYNNGTAVGSGQYNVQLMRPQIMQDTYSSIEADWNATPMLKGTFMLPNPWNVRGTVQNTVYVKVYETACSGTATSGYWTFDRSTCTFTAVDLKPVFVSQTNLNGTGETSAGTLVHANTAGLCKASYPRGARSTNTFYTISDVTGSCNNTMADTNIAVYPNPVGGGTYSCGDKLLYVVTGTNQNHSYPHLVEDYCPACRRHVHGTDDHVDNYVDQNSCTAASLPNFWEADLGVNGPQIQIPMTGSDVPEPASYSDNDVTVQANKVDDRFVLSINGPNGRKDVPLPPEIVQVQETHRYADRVIVIGDVGASVSRVMIIGVNNGTASDSFLAYNPAISPDGRYIAFIKWYPPHGAAGTADHQMLYDMSKSAMQNRPARVGVDDAVNVGVNVYPANGNRDGDNINVPERLANAIPGLAYWSADSTKLVFAAQAQASLKLVMVKVANGGSAAGALVMPLNRTSVCAAPLGGAGCEAYLDNVKFQTGGVKAFFSGTGTKGSIHRELVVKDADFVASH